MSYTFVRENFITNVFGGFANITDIVNVSQYGIDAVMQCKASAEFKNPEIFYNKLSEPHATYINIDYKNGTKKFLKLLSFTVKKIK